MESPRREPSQRLSTPRCRRGFTLVDLMITVAILGILVAAVIPLYNNYYEDAAEVSAQTSFEAMRRALDMHWIEHGSWPDEITPALFQTGQAPYLPHGYSFDYDPDTGALELNMPE
ncbi:MAG: type II secretion system protein [Phycisphaeraceae bacterium]|nr:MAG: type II secretion system protein [Phycisphaeraceae bacterium]